MDFKKYLKKYFKYIILAVGFFISAAFYVKTGNAEKIKIENETALISETETGTIAETETIAEEGQSIDKQPDDIKESLSPKEKELVKEYVRELLTEHIAKMEEASLENNKNSDKVNINTAGIKELMELNGIGEKKAEDIIGYRESHGAFLSIDELKNISGIKGYVFDKIKENIVV